MDFLILLLYTAFIAAIWCRIGYIHGRRVGTPSASHNSAMDAIALCTRIAQYHRDEKVLRYHWEDILTEAKRIVQQHQ